MDLFFDTETTGFPRHDLAPEHPAQARLVQLGAMLTEDEDIITALADAKACAEVFRALERRAA